MEVFQNPDLYGYIGMALSMSSFVLKNDSNLLKVNFFAAIFWALNGLLVGSMTAFLTQIVGAVVTLYRLFDQSEARVLRAGIVALLACIFLSWWSWAGPHSLPVAVATLFLVSALALAKGLSIRILFVAANTAFLLHAYLYSSTPQIIATLVAYPFLFAGLYRLVSARGDSLVTVEPIKS